MIIQKTKFPDHMLRTLNKAAIGLGMKKYDHKFALFTLDRNDWTERVGNIFSDNGHSRIGKRVEGELEHQLRCKNQGRLIVDADASLQKTLFIINKHMNYTE